MGNQNYLSQSRALRLHAEREDSDCEATTLTYMPSDLERSHDELRGALIVAGRHIGSCGTRDEANRYLKLLREVPAERATPVGNSMPPPVA